MTQMASFLAVLAYGLLISTFYSKRRGAYTRDKTTYVGSRAKNSGGLYTRGGVLA